MQLFLVLTIKLVDGCTRSALNVYVHVCCFRDNGVASSVVTREFIVEQAPIEEVVSTSMHIEEVEESSEEEEDDR